MTKYREATAVILGSYITFMIDIMLDKRGKANGSTIRLLQAIKSKIANKKYKEYRELSNIAWSKAIDELKDKHVEITVAQLVENIVFEREEIFKEFYVDRIVDLAGNFSVKHTIDNLDSKIVKDTQLFTDTLLKSLSKVVYDNVVKE